MIGGRLAGREHQSCISKRVLAHGRERLPHLDSMSANNAFHLWGEELHGMNDRGEIGVRRKDEFRAAPRRAECGGQQPGFPPIGSSENEFPVVHPHAVQFLRVIDAQEAIVHFVSGSVFAQDKSDVPASALDTAGSIQFGEESYEHAVSLPNPTGRRQGLSFGTYRWKRGSSRASKRGELLNTVDVDVSGLCIAIVLPEAVVYSDGE